MYNTIKSFNTFRQDGKEMISFYDERSQSVNIYDLNTRQLLKKLPLKRCFPKKKFYKTTAYTKNYDSIYVTNYTNLYLADSAGNIKSSVDFLEYPPFTWAIFENTTPPVFKNNLLYAAVRPYVKETSFKALKKWKVVYSFDFQNNRATLHYHMPELLQKNYYGHRFHDFSFCYNNKGNFVFSFPADTNIYETNLADYHVAYFAKSQHQQSPIQPVSKEALLNDEGYKNYLLRDSYGAIYYDPVKKRYLRAAYSKISEEDYEAKNRRKKQRLIIFDESFKIIGESSVPDDILLNTLFFTKDGAIYARVKPEDEYALHFVRLAYEENTVEPTQLTKNESN